MNLKNFIKPKKIFFISNFILLGVLIFSLSANQILLARINKALGVKNNFFGQIADKIGADSAGGRVSLSGDLAGDAVKLVISEGVPKIYGAEMGVSFGDVQPAINIMKQYDPSYGKNKITLTGDALKRYIDVAIRISCEYCCGAKSIIRPDGEAACGCAHSQAMRGLLAYLIKNHGGDYTNDELLRELSLWKGMYFPKQMINKMAEQMQSGNYTPDTASLVLGLDLPDYGGAGKEVPLPSQIKDLPGMVGGC